MSEYRWHGYAEYADGTERHIYRAYAENGNYRAENDRQHEIEAELIEARDDCTFYTVDLEEIA